MQLATANRAGFTMVEMMISLFILAMMTLSLGVSTIQARKLSEAAVYQQTALSVAIGYMEQIKSMEYQALLDAVAAPTTKPLPTRVDQGTADPLYINVANTKNVTVDTNDINGSVQVTMPMQITPAITNLKPITNYDAMEILLTYQWTAPDSKVPHVRALRSVRSFVPTF